GLDTVKLAEAAQGSLSGYGGGSERGGVAEAQASERDVAAASPLHQASNAFWRQANSDSGDARGQPKRLRQRSLSLLKSNVIGPRATRLNVEASLTQASDTASQQASSTYALDEVDAESMNRRHSPAKRALAAGSRSFDTGRAAELVPDEANRANRANREGEKLPSKLKPPSYAQSKLHNKTVCRPFSLGQALATLSNLVSAKGGKVAAVGKFITSLEGVPRSLHSTLRTLFLSNNSLKGLDGLQSFQLLNTLSVANNLVRYTTDLWPLGYLRALEALSLQGCPVADMPYYRWHHCVFLLPDSLRELDGTPVAEEERSMASGVVRTELAMQEKLMTGAAHVAVLEHMRGTVPQQLQ
ncbi:unnamed protein product, partial [Chrysoparadoxa australica]